MYHNEFTKYLEGVQCGTGQHRVCCFLVKPCCQFYKLIFLIQFFQEEDKIGDEDGVEIQAYDEEDMEIFQPTSKWQQVKTGNKTTPSFSPCTWKRYRK